MLYTEDHRNIMDSIRRFVSAEIDPFVDEWEAAEVFPAHELFKKMGNLGFLGITKPVEYGGMGLDFSYAVAAAEALGYARAQGVGWAELSSLEHGMARLAGSSAGRSKLAWLMRTLGVRLATSFYRLTSR